MDVREKLVELIAQKVCGAYSPTCDERQPHDCGKCYANDCNIADIADHLIAHGVTVQKWISVKDRLPEEGDRYLCRLKSFAFPGSFYQSILRYDKYGFQDGGVYEEGVTHWMPLPQPPKGE